MGLSVVYVSETGHVVGALGLTGGSAAADVASLVGASLPMRVELDAGEIAVLPLKDKTLGVAAADDEPGVFADPLAFGAELVEDQPPKPTLVRLAAWSDGLTLDGQGLTIEVPVAGNASATKVNALVSEGQDTLVLAGVIPAGAKKITLPVTVSAGRHGVLVLVAGWAGRLEALSKS